VPPDLPALDGVRHSYVDVNGFRAHVAEAGDPGAEPVVMLHGWPQHWWCWRKLIGPLAERYRVVCIDLRGHGWSDAPPHGYDKPQMASDLIAAMDELGLDRVRLVGHDWGAVAGYLACIRRPERFDRFLSCSVGPPFPSEDPRALLQVWRLAYQVVLSAPLVAPRLVSSPTFIKRMIRAGTRAEGAFTDADLDLYARVLSERPHVTIGVYRTFLMREAVPYARGEWAGRLRVPTRVLVGEHEPVARPELMRGHERHADDLRVHVLPGVAHFVPEEAPDAVLEHALAFF
jgi:pimeloyl-ACP methyl ester carboxylesterase